MVLKYPNLVSLSVSYVTCSLLGQTISLLYRNVLGQKSFDWSEAQIWREQSERSEMLRFNLNDGNFVSRSCFKQKMDWHQIQGTQSCLKHHTHTPVGPSQPLSFYSIYLHQSFLPVINYYFFSLYLCVS